MSGYAGRRAANQVNPHGCTAFGENPPPCLAASLQAVIP